MKKYLLIFAGTYCALAVPLLLLAVYLHKKSSLSLLSIALAGMAAGYFFARQNPDQVLEKTIKSAFAFRAVGVVLAIQLSFLMVYLLSIEPSLRNGLISVFLI